MIFMPSMRKALWIALALWCTATAALAQAGGDATKKLFDAVRANDKAKVQASIAEGADVNALNSLGMTAIDIAVDKGYYDLAHFLLGVRNAARLPEAAKPGPGPLASQPMPVGSVQNSEVLGAPGGPSQYVTVPTTAPSPGAPAYTPPPAAPVARPAAPPAPRLAPGQPNPFDPAQTVVVTRIAKPAAPPPSGLPPIQKAPKREGLLDKVKSIFSEEEAAPVTPVDKSVGNLQTDQTVGKSSPAASALPPPVVANPPPVATPAPPAVAAPPPPVPAEAQPPSPGLMDRLKGIFGSSPDKSSAVEPEPIAPTPVAAAPPPPDPPPAKPATASKEGAMARLARAETHSEPEPASPPPAQVAKIEPLPAEPAVAGPASAPSAPPVVAEAPPPPAGPNLFQKLGSWFSSGPEPTSEPVKIAPEPAGQPPAAAAAPKPAPVAAWVANNPTIFDPAKPASSAAPLPPEAVPVPTSPPPVPVKTAARAPEPPKPQAPVQKATQPPLQGVPLTLGRSLILGRQQAAGPEAEQYCLQKKSWQGVYCVENADWPEAVRDHFSVHSSLYQGTRAVVRYDAGRASRYHSQFNNQDFDKVAAYLESLLGPPTDIPHPKTAWLGRSREPNTTYRWISQGAAGNGVDAILEVRRFDDASGTFPDAQRGSIQLYRADAQPIFQELSSLDLALQAVSRGKTKR